MLLNSFDFVIYMHLYLTMVHGMKHLSKTMILG